MNESRKPVTPTRIGFLVMALCLMPAASVWATASTTLAGVTPSKHKTAHARSQKQTKQASAAQTAVTEKRAKPAPALSVNQPPLQPAVISPAQVLPAAMSLATPPDVIAATPAPSGGVAAAPVVAAVDQTVNPYLDGWYRPTPAAALPAAAIHQLDYNVRSISDRVTSIPGKLVEALPSIKTVHPTGGRDLVVVNLKCPAEMITGQYMLLANALREGVNGLFSKLNDTQLLKFDIQLVCS